VAVPFGNGTAVFDEARKKNVRKYHSMEENLREGGDVVEGQEFLVGALG
jgi:hypothetical protein